MSYYDDGGSLHTVGIGFKSQLHPLSLGTRFSYLLSGNQPNASLIGMM